MAYISKPNALRDRFSALFFIGVLFSACLPQATRTGAGPVSGPGVLGASEEGRAEEKVSGVDEGAGSPDEVFSKTAPAAGGPFEGSVPPPPPGGGSDTTDAQMKVSFGDMMPGGQRAPIGTVGEETGLALDQGAKTNQCAVGRLTRVNVTGRLVEMREDEPAPYAVDARFFKLRVYYATETGGRSGEFVEADFTPMFRSDFWEFDVSVLTKDPASLRFYVFNPLTNKWTDQVDTEALEVGLGPSPLPPCFEITIIKGGR